MLNPQSQETLRVRGGRMPQASSLTGPTGTSTGSYTPPNNTMPNPRGFGYPQPLQQAQTVNVQQPASAYYTSPQPRQQMQQQQQQQQQPPLQSYKTNPSADTSINIATLSSSFDATSPRAVAQSVTRVAKVGLNRLANYANPYVPGGLGGNALSKKNDDHGYNADAGVIGGGGGGSGGGDMYNTNSYVMSQGREPSPAVDIHYSRRHGMSGPTPSNVSLEAFTKFMYTLVVLSTFSIIMALATLGFTAGGLAITLTLCICIVSFFYSIWLTNWIMKHDASNPKMRVISDAIKEGSEGFLSVQYGTIVKVAVVVAISLFMIYLFRASPAEVEINNFIIASLTAASFVLGAFCSALAGYMGVWVSVRVNIRVAIACSKFDYNSALKLSFRGGAVSSVLSASMCILGVSILYLFCHIYFVTWSGLPIHHVPVLLGGYGFGASFVALFMQLGGGIYTKV